MNKETMKITRRRSYRQLDFFKAHVALLCDADKRAAHIGVNFVASTALVHAMDEVYQRRIAKAARFRGKVAR